MADEFVRVKLGADAKAWLEDCANREGLEPATFLRRMVYVAMNGLAAPIAAAVSSGQVAAQDEADSYPTHLPDVDIDAIVAGRVADAEARGLNNLEMPETSEPDAGVRPLHRRPVPFSVGTQPSWMVGS